MSAIALLFPSIPPGVWTSRHASPGDVATQLPEGDEDEDHRREADHDEHGPGDVLLRVLRLLPRLGDDLVPLEDDEREAHGPEEGDELGERGVALEERGEVSRREAAAPEDRREGEHDERDDDGEEGHRDGRLRAARDLRPAVVEGDERAGREDREQLAGAALVEAEEVEVGLAQDRLQGDDGPEAESEDVKGCDDAVAEPGEPAAEEAPRVSHGPPDPKVPAPRLREGGPELHVGHRGQEGHEEVQEEREEQGRPRDREPGTDEQEDRRPDRRPEADHRDVEEAEVPAELDLDVRAAAPRHRDAAMRGGVIKTWRGRGSPSNTSRDSRGRGRTAGRRPRGPVPRGWPPPRRGRPPRRPPRRTPGGPGRAPELVGEGPGSPPPPPPP